MNIVSNFILQIEKIIGKSKISLVYLGDDTLENKIGFNKKFNLSFLLWNTVHETSFTPPHPHHPPPHPLKIRN
jgi:hypothetical protein